ncbi:hypothetical protein [Argonema galeatum]|uniref:hypothetical protein n=1 Tax=Argonema galeatum TaxID=2942762 RepID=UPI00201124DD|nr:hypothetical protein [Argonema galeatum]MCL1464332.1 hypothetical protein [Argonema galeatum A003/A1]
MARFPEETITRVLHLQRLLLLGNSLAQSIGRAQAAVDASAASVQEAKRDWNIL